MALEATQKRPEGRGTAQSSIQGAVVERLPHIPCASKFPHC